MKKLFLLIAAGCLFLNSAFSQNIQWQNTIGGSGEDKLYSLSLTTDGGCICGGTSNSNISGDKTENSLGNRDYWIVKLDALGNIQWQNTIGGSNHDDLYSISQTVDGGYICGGLSTSDISGDKTENSLGNADYWLIKLDAVGNIQWQNTIGGNNNEYLYSIIQTSDGGYVCGGHSNSNISGDKTENSQNNTYDYWVVKLDSLGNAQWQNTIGGDNWDELHSIYQTIDGGYMCGGYSNSNISGDKTENSWNNTYDYWVVKLDSLGNIQWQNTMGGSNDDLLHSISQTIDGNYICGGYSNSNSSGDKTENTVGLYDYWIIKFIAPGIIHWQNTIGGGDIDWLFSISQTVNVGYVLGGRSRSNISGDKTENCNGFTDYWIVKTDSFGIIQWQNTVGGTNDDFLFSIKQTVDGAYYCGGYSLSSISGDKTENSMGSWDYWVVKINDTTITTTTQSAIQNPQSVITISPNPANEYSVISFQFKAGDEIRLTDVLGKTLFTKTIAAPTLNFKLQTLNFPNGIYFLNVQTQKGMVSSKVIVQH
ncbi:MAG: T9SS type A sorting domain-containing protein [Bacteroidia bacterium]